MKSDQQQRLVQNMLDIAGVQIDGGRPFDIKVNDPRLYAAVLGNGTLGLGEAYMDGWWDCPALDQFFERVLAVELEKRVLRSKALLWAALKTRVLNPQRLTKAFEIGEHHYDIGNDLFVKMLDKGLNY
ncbi:MAG: cyclopropane-fatty-acyl-phospholipid synthase, partial [Armatimonadetes bacterium]|nr:cyclopropane-fatty-acyl-phospholipid synthase [Armatimonadota bacterium]